jgi:hypothetical protein
MSATNIYSNSFTKSESADQIPLPSYASLKSTPPDCPLTLFIISKSKHSSEFLLKLRTLKTSKKLQSLIPQSTPEGKESLIELISRHIHELMVDQYANYMISCLISESSQPQRIKILQSIKSHLINIACNQIGTHCLQNLVSLCSSVYEENIYISEFKGYVVSLSTHIYGSYVIQRLVTTLKNKSALVSDLIGHSSDLSRHRLGICIIKRCVHDCRIKDEILADVVELIQDPFGNYAVQYVLEIWGEKAYSQFTSHLKGIVVSLSSQKFSSNVLAKHMREEFILGEFYPEIMMDDSLKMLLGNSYGCYVIYALATHAKLPLKEKLYNKMNAILPSIKIRKLEPRWREIMNQLRI